MSLTPPRSSLGGHAVSAKRKTDDFYPTPPDATFALTNRYFKYIDGCHVHEPCCGDGAISKVLKHYGCNVTSTDLVYRGYGVPSIDYLTLDPCDVPALVGVPVITNPPFIFWDEFVRKALEDFQAPFVAMLALSLIHI